MVIVEVSAQETSRETCATNETIYRDGSVVYSCEIVDRDGTLIVRETDSTGAVTERPVTEREAVNYQRANAERACLAGIEQARIVISTPMARGDSTEVVTHVNAIQTILREC